MFPLRETISGIKKTVLARFSDIIPMSSAFTINRTSKRQIGRGNTVKIKDIDHKKRIRPRTGYPAVGRRQGGHADGHRPGTHAYPFTGNRFMAQKGCI